MITDTDIQRERERLYESAVLREELNDDEATVLLEWGEKHVQRLAHAAADMAALEQQARFLRQLLKNINRFIGQRQYNNRDEQLDYLEKVVQWLAKLGFKEWSTPDLLDKLPADTKDMAATLKTMLQLIDPPNASPTDAPNSPGGRPSALQVAVDAQSTPAKMDAPENPRPRGVGDGVQSHPAHQKPPVSQEKQTPSYEPPRSSTQDQISPTRPDAKENEALEILRKNMTRSADQPMPDEDRHTTKASPVDDAETSDPLKSIRDFLQSHLGDKGKDDGKTSE